MCNLLIYLGKGIFCISGGYAGERRLLCTTIWKWGRKVKSKRTVWHLLNQSCSSSSQQKVVMKDAKDGSYPIFPQAQEISNKFEHTILCNILA